MRTLRNELVLWAIAIAILALPAAATAESVVPPGNSAATQYTEAIPTGGGQKETGSGGRREKLTPAAVLGSRKARKLNAQGPQGHAAAEVAAATAPSTGGASALARSGPGGAAGGGNGGSGAKAREHSADRANGLTPPHPAMVLSDDPGGSSGLGEVVAQATGSSGQLGLLLPLLIVGTILWSLAFLWRQRQRVG